nr:hypothetical protein [Candidatus Sigynarchaeota archaeon]
MIDLDLRRFEPRDCAIAVARIAAMGHLAISGFVFSVGSFVYGHATLMADDHLAIGTRRVMAGIRIVLASCHSLLFKKSEGPGYKPLGILHILPRRHICVSFENEFTRRPGPDVGISGYIDNLGHEVTNLIETRLLKISYSFWKVFRNEY